MKHLRQKAAMKHLSGLHFSPFNIFGHSVVLYLRHRSEFERLGIHADLRASGRFLREIEGCIRNEAVGEFHEEIE